METQKPDFPMPNVGLNRFYEGLFKYGLIAVGAVIVLILLSILYTLFVESLPSIKAFGLGFLWSGEWNPYTKEFGALPFLIGTFVTSILALFICIPVSLAVAIYLGEYLKDGWLATLLRGVIELLAGIPSVIYGFWGLFVLVPVVRSFEMKIGVIPYGVGILTASLILSIMIIPYAASLGRDVVSMVPNDLKEAALSLGATRFEMVRHVVLPFAKSGMFSGVFLSFGRAVGETMAVTMVIGNSNFIPTSIFSPANTMSSVLANEFAEASEAVYVSSLVQLALVLFIATTVLSFLGRYLINKWKI